MGSNDRAVATKCSSPITVYNDIWAHALERSPSYKNAVNPVYLNATPFEVELEMHGSIGQLIVCHWAVNYGVAGA